MHGLPEAPRDVVAVLPSLDPSEKFDAVVDGLAAAGFQTLVIVDDGSRAESKPHFARAAEKSCVTVLTHERNRGKGAALKTAFAWIREHCPDCRGVVTVDGDGQHRLPDILRCADALEDENTIVMGCRDFSAEHIPARSRTGNRITSAVFRLLCGIRLSDTQGGLRVFPAALLPRLLTIRGDRFEYETNMLLELSRQGIRVKEIPIETVYEENNKESHFRPVTDSLRIYRFILPYALSSLTACAADLAVFYTFRLLFEGRTADGLAVLFATVISRGISSFLNFNLNRKLVFRERGSYGRTLWRYYCLAVPQMLTSAGLVALLSRLADSGATVLTTVLKFLVDIALFFISYLFQQRWVFRRKA